jgi:hypothetical protein
MTSSSLSAEHEHGVLFFEHEHDRAAHDLYSLEAARI